MAHHPIRTILASLVLLLCLAAPRASQAVSITLGLGFDRAHDGHGFDLHKVGDTYILYFYTYDAQGRPEWYLGTAASTDGVLSGTLSRFTYDAAANPPASVDPSGGGNFVLNFNGAAGAAACADGVDRSSAQQLSTFQWTLDGESGTWCTEWLAFGAQAASNPYYGGVWYAGDADPGYGFTMSHMDNTVVAIFYYYDTNGDARWALGSANDSDASVPLLHFDGYCRSCALQNTVTSDAGTLQLTWDATTTPGSGNDQATVDLNYPVAPFGNFQRDFTLNRLSDGASSADFCLQGTNRLSSLASQLVHKTRVPTYDSGGRKVDSVATDKSVQGIEEFDVAYTPPADGDPQMAKLDVYYQSDGKPKRLMVFIHGGSWVSGDKSNLRTSDSLVQWFLENGFVVAAPNFRLATRPGEPQLVTYREQGTDIAHALAWLNENSAKYGVTEKGILLLGFSSGAHLVPLVATDQSYLQSVGLDLGHIIGTISLDIHVYDVPFALQLMQGSVVAANIPLIKFLFGDTEEMQLHGSPAFYAPNVSVPPSLIISAEPSSTVGSHGYVTSQASERYVQLLLGLGRQATWRHFDNEMHESLVSDFGINGDGPTEAVAQFLDSLGTCQ